MYEIFSLSRPLSRKNEPYDSRSPLHRYAFSLVSYRHLEQEYPDEGHVQDAFDGGTSVQNTDMLSARLQIRERPRVKREEEREEEENEEEENGEEEEETR